MSPAIQNYVNHEKVYNGSFRIQDIGKVSELFVFSNLNL